MWLPLQLTLEFIGRSALWLAAMAALAVAAALIVAALTRHPRRRVWPGMILAALVGALLGASLMDRFNLPEALYWRVWRRTVPLAWSAGGALLGAVAAAYLPRLAGRARGRGAGPQDGSTPPEGSEGSPGGDGAPPPPDGGTPR